MSTARLSAKDDTTGRLIQVFKDMIADGSLQPGSRLPAERDLAEQFSVSRSSLRQALKVLEIMGVINQRVGDGTYLNAGAASILREAMDFLILMDDISFRELADARLFVEPQLAELAAEKATPEDIEELKRIHLEMERTTVMTEHVDWDLQFHETIFRIAGNRICSRMLASVHQAMREVMDVTSRTVAPAHTLRLHERIIEAIESGSGSLARRRMTEHLLDATGLFEDAGEEAKQTRDLDRQARQKDLRIAG